MRKFSICIFILLAGAKTFASCPLSANQSVDQVLSVLHAHTTQALLDKGCREKVELYQVVGQLNGVYKRNRQNHAYVGALSKMSQLMNLQWNPEPAYCPDQSDTLDSVIDKIKDRDPNALATCRANSIFFNLGLLRSTLRLNATEHPAAPRALQTIEAAAQIFRDRSSPTRSEFTPDFTFIDGGSTD